MRPLPGSPATVARTLVGPALGLGRGEHLVVASWSHTFPWAAATVEEARRVGAVPVLWLEDEATFWRSVEGARSVRHWAGIPPAIRAAVRRADAVVQFPGPADRPRLRALPPPLHAPLAARDDEWFGLVRAAGVRGLRCLLGYASDARADHWGVPGALWRSRLIRGVTTADYDEIGRAAARAARLLGRGRRLHLTAPNGTDLTVKLRGRTPWIDDGRVDAEDRRRGRPVATAPAGSVVVAVAEGSAEGTVVANRPSYLSAGRTEGAQWEIAGGRLRNYWYPEGAEAFEAEFAAAPPGREVVSLVALGLNPKVAPGLPQAEDLEAGRSPSRSGATRSTGDGTGADSSPGSPSGRRRSPWTGSRSATAAESSRRVRRGPEFFDRPTVRVARELLGTLLTVAGPAGRTTVRLVETEAYVARDPANHAYRGPTPRNRSMFGRPGTLYVYRIHQVVCANLVTRPGEAVLLRAGAPCGPGDDRPTGPGRLCRVLGITIADDGTDAARGARASLWSDGERRGRVVRGPRVGLRRAVDRPLRFAIAGDPWVSRPAVRPTRGLSGASPSRTRGGARSSRSRTKRTRPSDGGTSAARTDGR